MLTSLFNTLRNIKNLTIGFDTFEKYQIFCFSSQESDTTSDNPEHHTTPHHTTPHHTFFSPNTSGNLHHLQ